MLGSNMRSTLLHAFKNIILDQYTGLGNYIVDLVCIGNINKNITPCLCRDMWRASCININIKFQHTPSMDRTKIKYHIMGTKMSGNPMR